MSSTRAKIVASELTTKSALTTESALTPEPADADFRIILAQSCPSITGKSTLTYHIGMAGNEPQIRITGNTGPGFFNDEWIPLVKVIGTLPTSDVFPSRVLRKSFQGRSLNSYAFLMAALHSEGVVRRSPERHRCWERADVDGFLARVDAMSGSDLLSGSGSRSGSTSSSDSGADVKAASSASKVVVSTKSKAALKTAGSKPLPNTASKSVVKPKK